MMLHKFLGLIPIRFLIIILAIFQQSSCLPGSSKEIDKARAKHNSEKNYSEKFDAFAKSVTQTKIEIARLSATLPTISSSDKLRLIKICKEFLEGKYIPYLQAQKEYLGHIIKCETNPSHKRKYADGLQHVKDYLLYVEALLRKNAVDKWCNFIIEHVAIPK